MIGATKRKSKLSFRPTTRLAISSFDAAILLSVIEHGVDLEKLFIELNRILTEGGLVYLSTDYWEETVDNGASAVASGSCKNKPLPWSIFDRSSVGRLLNTAEKFGFRVCGDGEIPPCENQPIFWQGHHYTFIAVEFEKVRSGQ